MHLQRVFHINEPILKRQSITDRPQSSQSWSRLSAVAMAAPALFKEREGASRYDVCKISDFLTPSPLCPHLDLKYTTKFTQPPLLCTPSDADIISQSSQTLLTFGGNFVFTFRRMWNNNSIETLDGILILLEKNLMKQLLGLKKCGHLIWMSLSNLDSESVPLLVYRSKSLIPNSWWKGLQDDLNHPEIQYRRDWINKRAMALKTSVGPYGPFWQPPRPLQPPNNLRIEPWELIATGSPLLRTPSLRSARLWTIPFVSELPIHDSFTKEIISKVKRFRNHEKSIPIPSKTRNWNTIHESFRASDRHTVNAPGSSLLRNPSLRSVGERWPIDERSLRAARKNIQSL